MFLERRKAMKMSSVFGPTIQGEGKSSGMRVMFVRLSLCNLHCVWCDTPYTWNWTGTKFAHSQKFDMAKEVKVMSNDEIICELLKHSDCEAVVISGGEPLIQQRELIDLCTKLKVFGYWIEIETNGTIAPTLELVQVVDQFNCSPKLSNSGDEKRLRIKPEALRAHVKFGRTNFKFVVSQDSDVAEIVSLVHEYEMTDVYLMPEGVTSEALQAREEQVRELCRAYAFNFTQRLHIIELGGGRYV